MSSNNAHADECPYRRLHGLRELREKARVAIEPVFAELVALADELREAGGSAIADPQTHGGAVFWAHYSVGSSPGAPGRSACAECEVTSTERENRDLGERIHAVELRWRVAAISFGQARDAYETALREELQ